MKIAFTICSNNYLSQAKTLGDSVLKYNPDYKFIIGLCDKLNLDVDYSPFDQFKIIPLEEIDIPNIAWMIEHYNIIELNTAIKPFYFQHFIRSSQDLEIAMYLDPDILVFNSFASLENEIKGKTAILTPHIESPTPSDLKYPRDEVFLNHGIYNLGFIAIRPSEEANKLLQWWCDWLSEKSFDKLSEGLFVDQLPMNFAPVFFNDVIVTKNKGCNFAYWNFHERRLSIKDNIYFINEQFPLIFMHFSAFIPTDPIEISRFQTRFSLENKPLLKTVFEEYKSLLIENKYFELKATPCYYTINSELNKQTVENKSRRGIKQIVKRALRL